VLTTGLSPAGKMETEGKNLRKNTFGFNKKKGIHGKEEKEFA
jgi:hypothetical protein